MYKRWSLVPAIAGVSVASGNSH